MSADGRFVAGRVRGAWHVGGQRMQRVGLSLSRNA